MRCTTILLRIQALIIYQITGHQKVWGPLQEEVGP